MNPEIQFDTDCATERDLQLLKTKQAIFEKLRVIFGEASFSSEITPPESHPKVATLASRRL